MSTTDFLHTQAAEIERLREIIRQGVAMRKAQKDYFANKGNFRLQKSKQLEAYFDKAASDALADHDGTNPKQAGLF
jgi:hypothetical protein